jgi:DNA-binding GntR family transcriptional regulator
MTTKTNPPAQAVELRLDDQITEDLAGSVYRELRAAICDFRLQPNQRLVQNALADELGISRTPVRDALLRLAQEGLVQPAPQRGGYLVSEFTAREVLDIYDVRLALEPDAAAEVAGQHGAVSIATLRELNAKIASQPTADIAGTFELNRAFHALVVAPSENVIIRQMLDQLWSMPSALRMYHLQMLDGHDSSQMVEAQETIVVAQMVEEHETIVVALENGDSAAVRAALASHIELARADAVQHVERDAT